MIMDEIFASPHWHCVDFISDLHLQDSEPENFSAWRTCLEQSPADAIFILGDLFEVWVGDDVLGVDSGLEHGLSSASVFETHCCQVLRECAKKRPVYFMHGNRDFLVGQGFAQACGVQILSDPSVLAFAGQRYLLSHGDALCLADSDYQNFRQTVRSSAWQEKFLATPLQERLQHARMIRQASESRKQQQVAMGQAWVDVDIPAAERWMNAVQAQHFIHGHTHEGRNHAIESLQGAGVRHVLPEWDVAGQPARGYVLRLTRSQHLSQVPSQGQVLVDAQHIALG